MGFDPYNDSVEQVIRTATVTFTDTYPMINESGVLESISDPVTCTVDYTVGGNPDAGQVTEVPRSIPHILRLRAISSTKLHTPWTERGRTTSVR